MVTDFLPHVAEDDFIWGIWEYEPDYYVYLPDFDWLVGEIYGDPRFEQLCDRVTVVSGPRESDFVIYSRIK